MICISQMKWRQRRQGHTTWCRTSLRNILATRVVRGWEEDLQLEPSSRGRHTPSLALGTKVPDSVNGMESVPWVLATVLPCGHEEVRPTPATHPQQQTSLVFLADPPGRMRLCLEAFPLGEVHSPSHPRAKEKEAPTAGLTLVCQHCILSRFRTEKSSTALLKTFL